MQGIAAPDLPSRLAIYWAARAENGDNNVDGGTFVHSAVDAVANLGYCHEFAWPFSDDPAIVNKAPPWDVFRASADQRLINGAHRILSLGAQKVLEVKSAIAAGHPVVFGTAVDDVFMDLPRGQVWQGAKGIIQGGHALCLTGYSPTSFELVNSWSTDWSDSGFGLVSFDSIASEDATDLWVLDVVEPFSA